MTVRVICVGNRYVEADAAGPAVHDLLRSRCLPEGVELIDGGIAGLDLLRWIEGARRVVFVDAVSGLEATDGVTVLRGAEVASLAEGADAACGHAAGIPALLRLAPLVCDPPLPEVLLVGVEAGAGPAALARAAERVELLAAAAPGGTP